MDKLRVAISPDVVSKDGRPIYDPSVLSILDHPRIEWSYLEEPVAEVTPGFAARYDALEHGEALASFAGRYDAVHMANACRIERGCKDRQVAS